MRYIFKENQSDKLLRLGWLECHSVYREEKSCPRSGE